MERIGVDRAVKAAEDADLIIYVADGSRPLDDSDYEIMGLIRDKKTIVLLNKTDLKLAVDKEALEAQCGHCVIPISAKEERGIEHWRLRSSPCFTMVTLHLTIRYILQAPAIRRRWRQR